MKPIRVLLIDDEDGIRVILTKYFAGRADIDLCAAARDGLEGLELIYRYLPDVVLLDLIMPGMDGLGVLEAIRRQPPGKMPAVVVASQVSEGRVVSHCLRLGASYYLIKPLDLEHLSRIICELCRDSLEIQAQHLLSEMGAPEKGRGFVQASAAAAAIAREAGRQILLKEAYYYTIAQEHTSYACIEKNIRTMTTAIHKAGLPAYHALIGGRPPRPPGNLIFLRRLAERIREEM